MKSVCATFLLLASFAPAAQISGGKFDTLYRFDGPSSVDECGRSVSGAGDVNADGFDDVIVGTPFGGGSTEGFASVYSGADGSLLYQFDGLTSSDEFGAAVSAAGDVNGDGFNDLFIGAPMANNWLTQDSGAAYVYSGADGSLIYQFDPLGPDEFFGSSISIAGDVNADGVTDLIVGAYGSSYFNGQPETGAAYVFSGADGTYLHFFAGAAAYDRFGRGVSGAGDVNNDGFADLICGAPLADPGGRFDAGSTFVYSGANGSLLHQFDGAASDDTFGHSVSDLGDINADGFDDLLIGSPNANPSGLSDAGSAFVYSGADGSLLHQFHGTISGESLGRSVSGAEDFDADGTPDFLIGAPFFPVGSSEAGSAFLHSGNDGSLLHQFQSAITNHNLFGHSVSGAGDINADGYPDLIIGAPFSDEGGRYKSGSAYVFGFAPFLRLTSTTVSAASNTTTGLQLSFPSEAASYEYRVLLSAAGTGPSFYGVEIPLSMDNYAIDSYFGIYPFPTSADLQGTLDGNAMANASFDTPAGFLSSVVGHTVYFAAIASPLGLLPEYSSIAVAVEIIP